MVSNESLMLLPPACQDEICLISLSTYVISNALAEYPTDEDRTIKLASIANIKYVTLRSGSRQVF